MSQTPAPSPRVLTPLETEYERINGHFLSGSQDISCAAIAGILFRKLAQALLVENAVLRAENAERRVIEEQLLRGNEYPSESEMALKAS